MNGQDDRANKRPSVEDAILEGLTEFRDAVRDDKANLNERFTMRTVELDLEVIELEGEDVRSIRAKFEASQAVFAKLIGVSVRTLQNWEQDRSPVPDMACRLFEMMDVDPDPWLERLRSGTKSSPSEATEECPS